MHTTGYAVATGFSSWVGTLPGWLTLFALVVAARIFARGGGGAAIDSLETANRVLEKDVDRLKAELAEQTKTIATLRSKTDVAEALAPLSELIRNHEARAQLRFDKTAVLLELVAERLGPDHPERT
jgi:outer membrane murein-binding lipoprotein Lpp